MQLNLPEHRPADSRGLGQALERQSTLDAQAAKIRTNGLRQVQFFNYRLGGTRLSRGSVRPRRGRHNAARRGARPSAHRGRGSFAPRTGARARACNLDDSGMLSGHVDLSLCNGHLSVIADNVKTGVY